MMKLYRLFYTKTPKIVDSNKNPIEDSIASLEKVRIGGIDQALLIRGFNKNNPLLLFIHGGPGYPEMGIYPELFYPLEKKFTLVYWDQRGAGKSYSRHIPSESITFYQIFQDMHELIQYLLSRFKKTRIFLVGHSWGSILSLRYIHQHPEMVKAFIGIGVVTDMFKSEKLGVDFILKMAKKDGNKKALKEMNEIKNIDLNSREYLKTQRKWLGYYGGAIYGEKSYGVEIKRLFSSHEYNLLDIVKFLLGEKFSLEHLDFSKINFFEEIKEVKVPIFFCLGKYDYQVNSKLAAEFLNQVKAPLKKIYWFEHSAHCPNFSEPKKLIRIIKKKILPKVNDYWK